MDTLETQLNSIFPKPNSPLQWIALAMECLDQAGVDPNEIKKLLRDLWERYSYQENGNIG